MGCAVDEQIKLPVALVDRRTYPFNCGVIRHIQREESGARAPILLGKIVKVFQSTQRSGECENCCTAFA